MIRWSPTTELLNLHGAMDRVFEDFFGPSSAGSGNQRRLTPTYTLPLDIKEVESGYEIHAPVPGFKPEEVDVTFSNAMLTIQAQHRQESAQQDGGYLRQEVAYGNYRRTIQLPGDVKEDEITAEFENGVLVVRVPKKEQPQPKRIAVTPSAQKQVTGKNA